MYCFLNGKIVKESEASLQLSDLAIIRGCSIFQVVRVYKGKPFLLQDHFEKLQEAAQKMSFTLPVQFSELQKAVSNLIQKNNLPESYLRLVLTGGQTFDGLNPCGGENFFILHRKVELLPEKNYEEGVKLISLEHRRSLPDIKTTEYVFPIYKRQQLGNNFDFIYTWQGQVLESTRANFFIIKQDTLITPENDVLHGVTRQKVLEIAEKSFKIEKREIMYDELKSVDEAFLTATTKEVVPIQKIDEIEIPTGEKASAIRKSFLGIV